MTEQRVTEARPTAVLERMDFLGGEPFRLDRLTGGLTNRNYKITTVSGHEYVARFSADKSALLAIDRDAEAYNSAVAAAIGLGPGVVEYRPADHVLIVEWINGRTFTDADLDDPDTLRRIAIACRALHSGPRFATAFDMFEVQREYLRIVRERGFRAPPDYLDFEPQVRRLDDLLHATSEGTVACHNDLLAANIMAAEPTGRVQFIDYEYSGNNDPCFELGNIWSEAVLDDDRLEHLVTSYYGAPSPARVARARLFAVMAQYGWTLWAAIQHAVSEVDFDFWTWGMAKYDRAVAAFRSPALDRLIDTVRESPREEAEPWPTPSS